MVKNLSAMQETRAGSPEDSGKTPLRREWLTTPAFLSEEFHGERSLGVIVHGATKRWTRLCD